MFKNTNSKRMTGILLALVLVTSIFIGGSIARYVTNTSSEDEARVAIWGINEGGTNMDLFNNVYEMPDGTIIAESSGGEEDKIIAPGTSNESQFKILTASSVRPEVMYEVSINLDDSEMPDEIKNHPGIQWKLDNGNYGTWEELKLSLYNLVGNDEGTAVFEPGKVSTELANGVTHTIGWQWVMDSGYDVEDTRLGNLAASGTPITAKVVVEMTAQQTNVDSTGMLYGNGSVYNTNAPQPLMFRADADYSTFKDVEINGTTLNPNNYTPADGSIKITLKKEYLETLPLGEHKITINTTDGKAIESMFTKTDSTTIFHNDVIPEGGTYYQGVTTEYPYVKDYAGATIYEAGQKFPSTVKPGDVYVYGDYEYRYNKSALAGSCWADSSIQGWGVAVLDNTKSTYGIILTKINNQNVTNLTNTFMGLFSLTSAPVIPKTIVSMSNAFASSGISRMPIIPDSVTEMAVAFNACSNLIEATNIPKNVTNIDVIFAGCNNLTGSIKIDANPDSYLAALYGTQITEITGSTTLKEEILATKNPIE